MQENQDFKIKLICPCAFENKSYTQQAQYIPVYYPPYGMVILTAFLRQHNYYVEQEDFCLKVNYHKNYLKPRFELDIRKYKEEIPEILKTGNFKCSLGLFIDRLLDSVSLDGFNLIGFSILSYRSSLFALLLSRRIKQRTDIPIVFGGPFITLYGHFYPEAFDFIDYMVVGDGRVPLLKLIDYLNKKIHLSEVPNLIHREDGRLITNHKEDYPIEDIPIPDFSDLPLEVYKNKYSNFSGYGIIFPYQISRGCTSRCSFCIYKYLYNKLEFKSYEKVLSELNQMKERCQSKTFYFCDNIINSSYGYLEGLCGLFIKNKLNINWNARARVGNLDRHILKKMKQAGCRWLSFGIESGSDRMLEMMHKGFTAEQASRTLQVAYEVGIESHINLISGHPYETQQDINETIEFIRRNRKYISYASVLIFHLLYGSPIYFNPERYGITNLISTSQPFVYGFDELNGLKWERKQKQQEDSRRQILKAIHKYMGFRNLLLPRLHYLRLLWLKLKEYVRKT